MSSTLFLVVVSTGLYFALRDANTPPNKYQEIVRGSQRRSYIGYAIILSGPCWGAMIGAFGGLLYRNKTGEDGAGIEFGKGVIVGAIGGGIYLTPIGLLMFFWAWRRLKKADEQYDEAARTEGMRKPKPKEVEEGVAVPTATGESPATS